MRLSYCHTDECRLASFALEEFETALEAFRHAQQMTISAASEEDTNSPQDPRKYRMWIRKCEAEMESEEVAEVALVKDSLNGEVEVAAGAVKKEVATAAAAVAAAHRAPVASAPVHLRTKFQYYQSYDKVM